MDGSMGFYERFRGGFIGGLCGVYLPFSKCANDFYDKLTADLTAIYGNNG